MSKEAWEGIHRTIEIIGPSLISLASVYLGWRLGYHSQWRQRRLDTLRERIEAFREIRGVIENIPPNLSSFELRDRLDGDNEFKNSLSGRMVRLFGLRTELIPYIDNKLTIFIDNNLKPLYVIENGKYDFRQEKIDEFSSAVIEFRRLSDLIETKLIADYENLTK